MKSFTEQRTNSIGFLKIIQRILPSICFDSVRIAFIFISRTKTNSLLPSHPLQCNTSYRSLNVMMVRSESHILGILFSNSYDLEAEDNLIPAFYYLL